jgi:hypothetical protein
MRPGNLIHLKIINCLTCYDFGEIVDPLDQAKRRRCPCGAASEQPTGSEGIGVAFDPIEHISKDINEF